MSECDCIATVNGAPQLKESGAQIIVNLLGPPRATVATYVEKKVRGKKPPIIFASYCPFCGKAYQDDIKTRECPVL